MMDKKMNGRGIKWIIGNVNGQVFLQVERGEEMKTSRTEESPSDSTRRSGLGSGHISPHSSTKE